ncbi:uncharacterized protein LOC122405108 [Colletes gigas]|uniref:uncharacterized protein LOC122405108 n=1 Tax=Colletes gigas TaxID=935657 RepID=UPI001C9AD11F|nr:uncharacterized protein LOC122405108 [Colletes gigas]
MNCKRSYCTTLTSKLNIVIKVCLISLTLIEKVHNASRTDMMKCKLTHKGIEYRGSIAKTVGDTQCQSWYSEEPIHEVSTDIGDHDFPERSIKNAKNYCRNPTEDVKGPWCYTLDPSLIDDKCDVPLCNFEECKVSGPGAEYGGSRKISASGGKCQSWHKHHKLEDAKYPNFEGKDFPDESVKKAGSFCRNPTGDHGGPWCYVKQEYSDYVEKEYCDTQFCDDKDCFTFTKNVSNYGILTKLNLASGHVSFWIKLWNPSDEKREEENFENTPEILLGTKWTRIWMTWGGGFISVGLEGTFKPLFMQEYKRRRAITYLYRGTFFHYGLRGTGVLWSTEFCQKHCEVHTTFGIEFSRVWAIQRNNDTADVRFHVRARRNILIRLYQTPTLEYPSITVTIGKDIISLIYQETKESVKQYLKEIPNRGILDFWVWKEFSISIFGEHFRLFLQKTRAAVELLYMNNNFFVTLRWFSIGSENTIAHWTLFCSPEAADAVEEPTLPNCISDAKGYEYNGTQWTSVNEIPCVPWVSKEVPGEEKNDKNFVDGSAVKALNKCRNPTRDPNGPYCYALTSQEKELISKQYCPIRNCRSSECRMAGTANDYVGTLSETRSGRNCDKWLTKYDSIANINREYFNDSLYSDGSAKSASNYCRNPSRNIAGTWCYTTDPLVLQDVCNVKDCEKSEQFTVLIRGDANGRRLYVLPEYRVEGLRFSLKAWEPDQPDSITFVLIADDGLKSRYILKIGALDNEKVLLYYESENEAAALVKKKTLPHLLFLGKWTNFILSIPRGKILLYYEDEPTPLFEWTHYDPDNAFLPTYYYYNSEKGRAVGISFNDDSDCQIENTKTNRYVRILSLSAWNKEEVTHPSQVTFHIRGKGTIYIPLFLLPATPGWSDNTLKVFCNATRVLLYEHVSPLIFYFFSVGVDPGGWATWSVNCMPIDIDGPPIDGGWSEWGPWTCSASCNGGSGTRKRRCDSPKANFKGEPCLGPNTMTGRCNEILCGDITEDTLTLINRRIRTNNTALVVKEFQSTRIDSDSDIVKLISEESPRSEMQWSLNGIFVQEEAGRVEMKDYNIEIIKASPNDSGVYAMTLHRIDGTYSIIKVISLAVIPLEKNVQIRETLSMTTVCHCTILGHVYSELQISWSIENKTWKDYGITLPIAANTQHVSTVNRTHDGLWQCTVKQNDFNFVWITNIISVKDQ